MTLVLVVDDEPAVRAALERALRLEAYEVDLAEDGREALDRLAGRRRPTRSCSTWRCRTSTGSRSAGGCATPATARPS